MYTRVWLQVIYSLSTPALAVLALVLFIRRQHRRIPFFFSYVLIACLSDIAQLMAYQWTSRTSKAYFYTFWISHLATTVLAILAICELILKRLFPQFQKIKLYRSLFPAAAVVIVILAVLTGFQSIRAVILVDIIHGIDFLQVAMLLFFVALMLFMGRQWQRYEFGIVLGFGVDAAAFLSAFAIFTRPGLMRSFAINMPAFAYDIACLVWLITFLKPEKPAPVPSGPISPEVLTEARKWQEAAKGSMTKKKDSE